ncbi:MAG: hypothetical protein V3S18_07475 [Dehalococcoidia bacterium]
MAAVCVADPAVVQALDAAVPGASGQATATLTGEEITLYSEDFDDGTAAGWTLESGWEVVEEASGNRALRGLGHVWASYEGDAWGDFTFKFRLKLVRGTIHINYRMRDCARYFIGFSESTLSLSKTSPCDEHPQLKTAGVQHTLGQWHDVEIAGEGGQLDIRVDGVLELSYLDREPIVFGGIAFETLDDSEALVDDVVVRGAAPPATGLEWVRTGGPLGGLGYDVRLRPGQPEVMLVSDAWAGVHRSVDGGRVWQASNAGIAARTGPSGDAIPVFSLTIDPHNPDIVWVGTQDQRGIFRSDDGGVTWAQKDRGVAEGFGITFRGFTVHPSDSDIVYAAAEISSWAWAGEALQGREFDLTKGVVYRTTDAGENWTAIWRGDNLARYVWIDPRDPDVIFVSTGIFDREAANSDAARNIPGGVGIVKSTDGGATWRTLGRESGLQNLYLGTLVMHPENPDVLLAGAGNNAYPPGAGAYLSADGGESWELVLDTFGDAITSVEFASTDPAVAYAGSASAIYRSADGGRTWARMTEGHIWGPPGVRAGVPIDFAADPRDPDRLFANNYGGGNFVSDDGGRTWRDASHGYTGAQLQDIAVDPADPKRVYVIGRTGPFCSTDGGTTWEGLNYDPATFAEWYAVAVDPSDPRTVLVSDEHQGIILRSTDGGRRWEIVLEHPGPDPDDFRQRHGYAAITFAPSDPSVVYAGMRRGRRNINEGLADPSFGIAVSMDGGLTWFDANDALTETRNVNVLAVDPSSATTAYAATVRGGVFKTVDGGRSWEAVNQGLAVLDIRALAIDPANPSLLYAGAENGGVYRSTDGAATWEAITIGMDPQAAIRDIVIDPSNTRLVYAADLRTGVYRSDDGGDMWIKIADGLRTRAVKALAISSDGSTVYAATEGEGVFRLDVSATASGG